MPARHASAARGLLLAGLAACTPTPAVDPPAQPAEVIAPLASPPAQLALSAAPAPAPTSKALAAPPPEATTRAPKATGDLDPALARRYRDALVDGRKYTDAGRYPAAVAAYGEALAAVPGDPRALSGRGHAHLLAGDLALAGEDLGLAADHASEVELAAEIHLDLGLLAERQHRDDEALRRFSLSNLYRPTDAAAARVAGRSICLAEVTRGNPDPAATADDPRPGSWSEIWTKWFEPSKANLKDPSPPADEAAARHRVCHYESLALDACEDPSPWVLRVPGGFSDDPDDPQFFDQYVLVAQAGSRLAVVPLLPIEDAALCDDLIDISLVDRDPVVVRKLRTRNALGSACTDAGDPEDCYERCVPGGTTTEIAVFARDTLDRLVAVETVNRPDDDQPLVDVRVTASGAKLTGGGCDATIPLRAP